MSTVWQFLLLGIGLSPGYVLSAQGMVAVYRGSAVVNFAQGGFALIGAFAGYELQQAGLSPVPALIGGIVGAALAGALTYLLVMRKLRSASQLIGVVATLGISVIITQGLSLHYTDTEYWPKRIVTNANVHIFGAYISKYDLILVGISAVLTGVLWATYRFTKFGLQTAAVSESPRAAAALGHSPEGIGLLNWAIGGALGGLAGGLIAPDIGLTTTSVSLLLIPTLAAGVLGRFRSFGLTFVGGLVVAVGSSELTRYNPGTGWSDAFPFLVVIAILVCRSSVLPARGESSDRMPGLGTGRVRWPLVLAGVVALGVVIAVIPSSGQSAMTVSLTAALICLSLTVVTGYGGQVSLAQLGLAGAGGFVAAKLAAEGGLTFWEALACGILVAIPVGAVVGLPALRARGVNLAIVTLGLGLTIQDVVLANPNLQDAGSGFETPTPTLFGYSFSGTDHPGRYATLCLILFAIAALVVANLRRGRVGRQLIALRANERAAVTLGINVTRAKLYAFIVGSAIAGLAGVLISFQPSFVLYVPGGGGPPFDPATAITLLSLTIVGGVGYIGGAIFAGQLFVNGIWTWILQEIFGTSSNVAGWLALAGGLGSVLVVLYNPDGLAASQARDFASVLARLSVRRQAKPATRRRAPRSSATASPSSPDCTLSLQGLGVRFGGVVALSDVSLDVHGGEIVGLIGPNGAGKTTLIDAVSGLNRRYDGRILFNGEAIDARNATARARAGIGRSFQSLELFDDLTVEDNLRAASELPSAVSYLSDLVAPTSEPLSTAAVAAVEEFDLEADLRRIPPELPFGRRRLVGIARAIAAGPKILLLDEPASGLDDHESQELASLLTRLAHERGIGILLVEHNVNLVIGVSDRVVALDFGRVIAHGEPEAVRHDPAVVTAYLGPAHAGGTAGSARQTAAQRRAGSSRVVPDPT